MCNLNYRQRRQCLITAETRVIWVVLIRLWPSVIQYISYFYNIKLYIFELSVIIRRNQYAALLRQASKQNRPNWLLHNISGRQIAALTLFILKPYREPPREQCKPLQTNV